MNHIYTNSCAKILTSLVCRRLSQSVFHNNYCNKALCIKHFSRTYSIASYYHSAAMGRLSSVAEMPERATAYNEKKTDRYRGKQIEKGHKMDKMSAVVRDFYRAQFKFTKHDMNHITALLDDVKHGGYDILKSEDFARGYEAVIHSEINHKNNGPELVRTFRNHCERMTEAELTALLYFIVRKNRGKLFDSWSQGVKSLFILLDREISRRLNVCYQLEVNETKEILNSFENVLKIMLENECGLHCFRTYVKYCTYRFDTVVNETNFPLLLLSLFKIYSGPPKMFELLEDFMIDHFDKFDYRTVYLFCSTFFICNTQILSETLLDKIGTKLLQQVSSVSETISCFNVVNVLKILAHSDYSKPSFYQNLESSLITGDFVDKCTLVETMWILHTYGAFRIYPKHLVERLVARFKELLLTKQKVRSKEIGRFVRLLGTFQYKDNNVNDIYTLCANFMVQEMKMLGAKARSETQLANAFVDCVDGLVYSGIFHDGLLDALFQVPELLDLLEEIKGEDLLLIHNTVKLEYPEYAGRKLNQRQIDLLQEAIDTKWTIDQELAQSVVLQECVAVLTSLLGEDKLSVGYILPHIKTADIEIYLNEEEEPVQPQFAKKKVAIEIIHGPLQCIKGTDQLVGKYILKLRQLKLKRYSLIMAYPHGDDGVLKYGSFEEKQRFWIGRLQENGIKMDSIVSQEHSST